VKKFSEEDKTDWLPGTLAPERDGVYERRYDQGDTVANVARFEGLNWYRGCDTVEGAAAERAASNYQADRDTALDFEWRGLARDPNVVTITPEVAVVKCDAPGLALDSGEFIPAAELNAQAVVDDEEQLF
jgi:hypothetical protein